MLQVNIVRIPPGLPRRRGVDDEVAGEPCALGLPPHLGGKCVYSLLADDGGGDDGEARAGGRRQRRRDDDGRGDAAVFVGGGGVCWLCWFVFWEGTALLAGEGVVSTGGRAGTAMGMRVELVAGGEKRTAREF